MDWGKALVWIIIGVQYVGFFVWYLWRHYVRPFLSYKLTVWDEDDEFVFIKRKRNFVINKDIKGVRLFTSKENPQGEFYVIPLEQEQDKALSKRDDDGMVSYYYWRNKPNPLRISSGNVASVPDSKLLSKIMSTKILDSSLLLDEKSIKVNWWLILAFAVVVVVVIFHKQIAVMVGLGG